MKRASIVIGFTPYHAYAARPIIKLLDGSIYCAFTKAWPIVEKHYIRIGPPESWAIYSKAPLTFLHFAALIHRLIARGCALDVYIPHPGHILSNYLFFTPIPGKRIFIYEDGLLNYYDADVKNSFVGNTKRLLARLSGLRYRDYTGHLAGYDAGSYYGAFLSMPDKAVRKDRLGTVNRLKFDKTELSLQPKTILFLDQNVSSQIPPEKRQHCISTMFSTYPPSEYTYHYKPHHDHTSELSGIMQRLELKLGSLPAEMLIERLRPSHVISFCSSALINIKNGWPEVECVSLAASQILITRDGKPSSLSKIFQEAGVKCL